MKSIIVNLFLLLILVFNDSVSNSATVYWDGEANDGQWSSPANWSANNLPSAGDDVVIDNSILIGSFTINLPSGVVTISINSLTISPTLPNTISLILPSTNTANPGLTITGLGNSFILDNNAIFKNSSGASAGSGIAITGSFKINNGGHYIHNTARGNATIVSQLSTVSGTELGIFEYSVPVASYVLSLSGRTFGTLLLSAPSASAVSYSGSGASPLTVAGDFIINSGVSFSTSMSANFIIKGNYTQASSSTFNLQSSVNNNIVQVKGNFTSAGTITETNTGLPVLELNGVVNQGIDATNATWVNNVDLKINNPAGVILQSGLTLAYRMSMVSGNLTLGNHILSTPLVNQVGIPNQTSNHFITNGTGYLKIRSVNTATIFAVGPSSGSYNPVTIIPSAANDFFVRVEDGINPSVAFPGYGINRTWSIYATTAAPSTNLIFQYASADANVNATQPQDMEILMHVSNTWNIVPGNNNITPAGADPAWTISSVTPMSINNVPTAHALGLDGGWTLPIGCLNCGLVFPGLAIIKQLEIKIFPIPATDQLNLKIKSPMRDVLTIMLLDVFGNKVLLKKFEINKGVTTTSIMVNDLPAGIYYLNVESNREGRGWFKIPFIIQ